MKISDDAWEQCSALLRGCWPGRVPDETLSAARFLVERTPVMAPPDVDAVVVQAVVDLCSDEDAKYPPSPAKIAGTYRRLTERHAARAERAKLVEEGVLHDDDDPLPETGVPAPEGTPALVRKAAKATRQERTGRMENLGES